MIVKPTVQIKQNHFKISMSFRSFGLRRFVSGYLKRNENQSDLHMNSPEEVLIPMLALDTVEVQIFKRMTAVNAIWIESAWIYQ